MERWKLTVVLAHRGLETQKLDEVQVRRTALSMALQVVQPGDGPGAYIETAKKFSDFMLNEDKKPE